jgi:hypothetical protein
LNNTLVITQPSPLTISIISSNSPICQGSTLNLSVTAIGGIGSALFHGFRAHPFFLYMDFVPIAVLTLGVSIYFWVKILPRWWYVLIIVAISIVLRFVGFAYTQGQSAINLSYLNTGLMIFIPALVYIFLTRFYAVRYLVWAILFLGLSLVFRMMDDWGLSFPAMGTHWLWHLFSATGALMLGEYLLRCQRFIK